eukprot:5329632-Prymnesium_polylepis.1
MCLARLGAYTCARRAVARTRQPRPLPSTASRLAVALATPPWKTVKTGHVSRRDRPTGGCA